MTGTLALLIRSLRTDVRLARSHVFRLLFIGLIYFSLLSIQQTSAIFGAPGLRLFEQILGLNLFVILAAAASFFATAITEEKEEQTLGLLRMAGISPLSLLLGKLAPRVVAAMLLLSLQVPFTFLAVTLGGVTQRQVLAAYVSLLAYTALLAGIGLLFSVVCRRSRSAAWRTTLTAIVLVIVPPYVSMLMTMVIGTPRNMLSAPARAAPEVVDWISSTSAFSSLMTISQTGFNGSIFSFQVVTNFAAAVVLLLLSWALFDRLNRGDASHAPERGFFTRDGTRRRALGPGRVWKRPFIWKDYHFVVGGKPMQAAKLILYGLGVFAFVGLVWVYDPRGRTSLNSQRVGEYLMGWMLAALLIEMAVYASRVFHEETKGNTLSTLMLLPYSRRHIAYHKIAACLGGLAPAVTWFAIGGMLNPEGVGDWLEYYLDRPEGRFSVVQYVFFLHLAAYLSLVVKWGGLGLAFILVYLLGSMLTSAIHVRRGMVGDWESAFDLLTLLGIVAVVVLHVAVGRRLRTLAAR